MPKIAFYRQKRADGGLHTGLMHDLDVVLERFDESEEPSDPALVWFVDVRAEGAKLPREGEQIRRWFLDQSAVVQQGLRALADELQAGMAVDTWPLTRKLAGAPRGVRLQVVCSIARRLDALDVSRLLRDVADHWQEYLHLPRSYESSVS
jgi:hypothetical protein